MISILYNHLYNKIIEKLKELAKSDNESIRIIQSFNRRRKVFSFASRYAAFFIIPAIFLFFLFGTSNNDSSSSYNSPANGELNITFVKDEPIIKDNSIIKSIPKLSFEERFELEKEKMRSKGWKETKVFNGQLPSFYNYVYQKSDIDNYLEVYVGEEQMLQSK